MKTQKEIICSKCNLWAAWTENDIVENSNAGFKAEMYQEIWNQIWEKRKKHFNHITEQF